MRKMKINTKTGNAIFTFLSIAAALHNLLTSLSISSSIPDVGAQRIYLMGITALSGLTGLAGSVLLIFKKKISAYVLVIAALICIVGKLLGLEGDAQFVWMFLYASASAIAFNSLNIVMNISFNYYGSSMSGVLRSVMDSENRDVIKKQGVWAAQVDEYIRNNGKIKYYGYIFAEIFAVTTPLIYAYLRTNNYPLDDLFSRVLMWGCSICIIVFAANELQRRFLVKHDETDKKDDVIKF